jgi:hypothetical protein
MKCPCCGKRLRGRRAKYGMVYVCQPCGLIIIEVVRYNLPRSDGTEIL